LSEMCISGKIGAKIEIPRDYISSYEYLFSEDQSRYLVDVNEENKNEVCKILEKNSVYYEIIGITQKDSLDLDKEFNINLSELTELNSFWFRDYFKES